MLVPDSDVDILLVMKGDLNYIELLKRSDDLAASVSLENDIVICARLFLKRIMKKDKLHSL